MDLHQLRDFYEIVREQSFTREADKLFLTQPAIDLQVTARGRTRRNSLGAQPPPDPPDPGG